MSDVFMLSESQMERIEPFFPLAHGVPRVDDRRVLSGIVYVIRNGFSGKTLRKRMVRTRLCIIVLSGGAAWVSLTGSLSP